MSKYCKFCGDELIKGMRSMEICSWCIKEFNDQQREAEKQAIPSYFDSDREGENLTGEIDYG